MAGYLRNVWHMAGWSEELGDGLLARRMFDRNIVLFRTRDGVAALADQRSKKLTFAPHEPGLPPRTDKD
jgi:hypothetical protein